MGAVIFIVGAAVIIWLARRSVPQARANAEGVSICGLDYLPPTLGIAPQWQREPKIDTAVRFYVDPSTGCAFQNRPGTTPRLDRITVLSNPEHINLFLRLNGLPPGRAAINPLDFAGQLGALQGDFGFHGQLTPEQAAAGATMGGTSGPGTGTSPCTSGQFVEQPQLQQAVIQSSSGRPQFPVGSFRPPGG